MTDGQTGRRKSMTKQYRRPEKLDTGQNGKEEMFSGQKINTKWIVLVAIAAFAVLAVACGTDDTKIISDGNDNGGVGAQPTAVADGSQGDPPPTDPSLGGYETVEVPSPATIIASRPSGGPR